MKVKELIEELSKLDPELEVFTAQPEYWEGDTEYVGINDPEVCFLAKDPSETLRMRTRKNQKNQIEAVII